MNILRILPAFFFSTLVAAPAAVSPIRIEVEQISKTELQGAKGGKGGARPDPMGEKTQRRELKIKLINNSNGSFSDLLVKYWFFGRSMKGKSHETDVLKKGERKAALGPRASELIESEVVTSSYVVEHNKVSSRAGSGVTKVPASGQKITGYAVKVLNGADVVAEYYSEDSLKKELNGGDAK
jgi:hypothetical protein